MTTTTIDETPRRRSPVLGIIDFAVAVLAYLAMPALITIAADAGVSSPLVAPAVIFGLTAVSALVAAITRRGRGWAIAALVIAVANAYSPIHAAISDLVRSIFG